MYTCVSKCKNNKKKSLKKNHQASLYKSPLLTDNHIKRLIGYHPRSKITDIANTWSPKLEYVHLNGNRLWFEDDVPKWITRSPSLVWACIITRRTSWLLELFSIRKMFQ
jgi:hypothetical protein